MVIMERPSTKAIMFDDSYADSGNSFFPSPQQLGFMAALHSDIILAIFSLLDQDDCLTCMAVCRDWYYTIPQYAENVWKILKLNVRDVHTMHHQRRIRCLGDHVKTVILDTFEQEKDLYHILHKLLDWGCTRIESLEFNQCASQDQDTFLKILVKLASHLTRIKMLDHLSNISFLHIFNACPKLTHFTYQIHARAHDASGTYHNEPVVHQSEELSSLSSTTKITHLCLAVPIKAETRLYPILRRCPDLRCFVGASINEPPILSWDEPLPEQFWDDLDQLFDACPKINYVQPHFPYYEISDIQDINKYTDNIDCTGIRYLDIGSAVGQERIARYLTRNQDTLEYLFFDGLLRSYDIEIGWSSVFGSLQLTQLHTLVLYRIDIDTVAFAAITNSCPVLKILELDFQLFPEFDLSALHSFRTLKQLQSLKLQCLKINDQSLMKILSHCPSLEKLELFQLYILLTSPTHFQHPNQLKYFTFSQGELLHADHISDMDDAAASFLRYLTARSQLETIHISYVENVRTKTLLSIVADITTLKVYDMVLESDTHCPGDTLCDFATLLLGTSIESLMIHSDIDLPSGFLAALRKLPSLKELYVSILDPYDGEDAPCKIDGSDLLQLLDGSKSLMAVYFHYVKVDMSKQVPQHDDGFSMLVEQRTPFYVLYNSDIYHPSPLKVDTWMNTTKYEVVIKRRV